jgi:hypothetical protein
MRGIGSFEKALWLISVLLEVGLTALLLYRKNYRTFPFFFAYVLTVIAQSAILFVTYKIWGFNSQASRASHWSTQGLVLVARALAVAEICRHALRKYRGIWELAWRLLLASAVLVLLYSLVAAGFEWQLLELNADRGLELTIAVLVVVLFVFAHYYEVAMEPVLRFVATGFFLYSCFSVLNDTVLERWKYAYAPLWSRMGSLAYVASLLLWNWALRERQTMATHEATLLPDGVYRTLAPEINMRLKVLNENLHRFWYPEGKRP